MLVRSIPVIPYLNVGSIIHGLICYIQHLPAQYRLDFIGAITDWNQVPKLICCSPPIPLLNVDSIVQDIPCHSEIESLEARLTDNTINVSPGNIPQMVKRPFLIWSSPPIPLLNVGSI